MSDTQATRRFSRVRSLSMRIPANTSIGFNPESKGLLLKDSANCSKVAVDGLRSPFSHRVQVASLKPDKRTLSLNLIDINESTRFLENSNVSSVYFIFILRLLDTMVSITHSIRKGARATLEMAKPPVASGKPLRILFSALHSWRVAVLI